ncbi:hypothetical protein MMC11_001549 [Xylographa trunciseda]|nr:hypothetical protein [Xylographa trunciseda]
MVYDWGSQEVNCRLMIVDEGKTQDEVLAALKAVGFAPSKRAFQNQISKWNFPPHRIPASKNPTLIEVVKELWKQHVLPAEMLRVLNGEKGFVVKKKELDNLRHSLGLYFRAPNAKKGQKANAGGLDGVDENDEGVDGEAGGKNGGVVAGDQHNVEDTTITTTIAISYRDESYQSDEMKDGLVTVDRPRRRNSAYLAANLTTPAFTSRPQKRKRANISSVRLPPVIQDSTLVYPTPLPADLAARRAVKDEADAAKAASIAVRHQRRHRHRQTSAVERGSRTPGPKFPSEMTLDEAKASLNLDQNMYRAIRDSFEEVCVTENIVRKKGSDNWQKAKDDLIASFPALYTLLNVTVTPTPNAFTQAATVPIDQQVQALDILCMDVTKQMRSRSIRMSVMEAKKVLGLDPAKAGKAKTALMHRLIANNFVSKTESGEHWKVMRDEWIAEQGLKTDTNSTKAADVLCADVMKRINDNRTKQSRLVHTGPVQITENKEQSPIVNEEEEEKEQANGTAGQKPNQGEVEPLGGYVSLPVPVSNAQPHLPYNPSAYTSVPLPLPVMTAFSIAATAAQHPALSPATVCGQAAHTYVPYAAPAEGFQNLYPEIDPEILAMHGHER